MVAAVDSV